MTPPACCRELGLETRAVGDEWLGRRNGIAGYNRMMLSEEFYASFPDTEYILICHTDAWIFRDELGDWCRRGYDCVAAPWLRRPLYDLPLVKQYMQWRERMKRRRGEASRQVLYGRVGNGGLSLRRVEAFRRACATYRTEAENYLADPCHLHNEDMSGRSCLVNSVIRRPTKRCVSRSTPIRPTPCGGWTAVCRSVVTAGRNAACGGRGGGSSPPRSDPRAGLLLHLSDQCRRFGIG